LLQPLSTKQWRRGFLVAEAVAKTAYAGNVLQGGELPSQSPTGGPSYATQSEFGFSSMAVLVVILGRAQRPLGIKLSAKEVIPVTIAAALRSTLDAATKAVGRALSQTALFFISTPLTSAPLSRGAFSLSVWPALA
jgi:hypothetical protein